MDLEDIRAAIADLDRRRVKLQKQIEHRHKEAAARKAEAARFERELEDVVDRWMKLIADERRLTGDTDA